MANTFSSGPCEVALVFPPQWSPFQPYLSIPSLTAYLRKSGVTVSQYDLNQEFYSLVLTSDYLKAFCHHLSQTFDSLDGQNAMLPHEEQQYQRIYFLKPHFDSTIEQIDSAKRSLRSPEFYDLDCLLAHKKILNTALNIVSAACEVGLKFGELEFPVDTSSLDSMTEFLEAPEKNCLLHVFEKQIRSVLQSGPFGIIGFSVTDISQVVPSLAMASAVKRMAPDTHVTFGGNFFTRTFEGVKRDPNFFAKFADSVILYEGERPLLSLVNAIRDGEPLSTVPNILYWDAGPQQTSLEEPSKINDLPPPDFDGLKLDEYLAPELILPVLTSRGCYWGKCTFCDHSFIYGDSFKQRKATLIASDLEYLSEKYGTTCFEIVDEALSPSSARKISLELIKMDRQFSLMALARLELAFSQDICNLMARAGIKYLMMGLESANAKVCGLMEKGTTGDVNAAVLERLRAAGIRVHLFVIAGFPGEDSEDFKETISFVSNHSESIFSIGASTFDLGKFTPIARFPEKFGVEISEPTSSDLSYTLPFKYTTGQTPESIEHMRLEVMSTAFKKLRYSKLWANLNRDEIFLYLKRFSNSQLDAIVAASSGEKDETDAADTETSTSLQPRLKNSVVLSQLNFDLSEVGADLELEKAKGVKKRTSYYAYDKETHNCLKLDPSGYAVLMLCKGGLSPKEIELALSDEMGGRQSA